MSNFLSKKWTSSFVIDETKLTRLLDVEGERFSRAGFRAEFAFSTRSHKGRTAKFSGFGDILKLDNLIRDPIRFLQVTTTAQEPGAGLRCSLEYDDAKKDNIRLEVQSMDSVLTTEVFAAVEEQVERTLITPWPHIGAMVGLIILLTTLILGLIMVTVGPQPYEPLLYKADIEELSRLTKSISDTSSKIDFLYEFHRRYVAALEAKYRPVELTKIMTFGNMCIGAAAMLSAAILAYLAIVCYPRAVFLWGDYGQYYATLVTRRRMLWNVIIIALVLGTVVNLVAAALWDRTHIPRP